MVQRVKTGIPNLDDLIAGGIPRGFSIFLSGPPGSGKSIFGLQYLWEGAKLGEKGVYVSLEQDISELHEQARQFGWDFEKISDKVKFVSFCLEGQIETDIMRNVLETVIDFGAKRLVFDSLSSYIDFTLPKLMKDRFFANVGTDIVSRYIVHLLLENLARLREVTTLLINEEKEKGSVAEFMADGIIGLKTGYIGEEPVKQLFVPKMRLTDNNALTHLFEITDRGIVLKGSGLV